MTIYRHEATKVTINKMLVVEADKILMNSANLGETHAGFTLIELVVTVAIVAILAAVAYPSYLNSIVKSNRAKAQSVLMDIAQQEKQVLLDTRSYVAGSNYTAIAAALNLSVDPKVDSLYTISASAVAAATPPSFTATAAPKAGGAQASDVTLTINDVGLKTPGGKW